MSYFFPPPLNFGMACESLHTSKYEHVYSHSIGTGHFGSGVYYAQSSKKLSRRPVSQKHDSLTIQLVCGGDPVSLFTSLSDRSWSESLEELVWGVRVGWRMEDVRSVEGEVKRGNGL